MYGISSENEKARGDFSLKNPLRLNARETDEKKISLCTDSERQGMSCLSSYYQKNIEGGDIFR